MTTKVPPIDWNAFYKARNDGQLMDLLAKLPRERFGERDDNGATLLHYACCGPNVAAVVALLQSGLAGVNSRNAGKNTPAHLAASWKQPRVLEVLCAAGADLKARSDAGNAPIDLAVWDAHKDGSVRVLVANGVRLSTVHEYCRKYITPELEAFERGVLRCRAAVVAMLRVRKTAQLYHVDKFLMRELAFAMWATRTTDQWQDK